jgi:uncharacterized membrane protein
VRNASGRAGRRTGGSVLKETVKSLRLYFIVIGVISGLLSASLLPGSSSFGVVFGVIGIVLGAGFLYVGIRLRDLLATSATPILALIYANMAMYVVSGVSSLSAGNTRGQVQAAIGLAISAYLVSNVKRLAAEMVSDPTPPPEGP